jgi:hypothetical protein
MKIILLNILRIIKRILFIEWNGYDLNQKSIDYIMGHYRLYERIKDIPGHIIELGAGSGRNSLIFGRFIKVNNQSGYKRIYGFDTFSGYPKSVLNQNTNLSSKNHKDFTYNDVKLRMQQNNLTDVVTLIKGVLPNSIHDFLEEGCDAFSKGDLKISLIYIDCNDFETAKESLMILKDFLSVGAIIAIDENRLGGETKALEYFSTQLNLPIKQWTSGGVISSYLEIV